MNSQPNTRWSVLLISLSMVIIMIAAAGVLRSQERLIRDQIASELASIARLKVNQIADWRHERLDEGAEVMERPLLRTLLSNWLSDPQQVDETILLAELRGMQRHDDYSDVLVVDLSGKILISINQIEGEIDGRNALEEAIHSGRPVLTELHIGTYNSEPHISTFVPILNSDGEPLGALALVTNVREYLFPLIQSWPTESQTAETLLVRRDGNDVLFLNDLRHQANAALQLRIPLTNATLPSTMVIKGIQGAIEARDYRGVDVIAHLQPIPDSDWYIVAKVDQSEALAGWNQRVAITTMLSLSAALLISLIALLLWQSQRRKHVEQLYAAEKEQHARDLRYRTIVQSIGDGVIATDAQGNVTMLNPVAEMLTGWSDEEARGKPLETVFIIINEESRQPVVNPVTRVLQKGRIVGLANHTLLIDRNGAERPIADAAAPIREGDGEIQGVVLIFRDQSAERAAQRSLAESEARNRAMIAAIPD
ncbi:MAG: PAS domain S-box protein, partial [Caldilinea sp.]|nr:PAS domain S-box protein [Caldilinea sp.]